jgi:hypothetical protein
MKNIVTKLLMFALLFLFACENSASKNDEYTENTDTSDNTEGAETRRDSMTYSVTVSGTFPKTIAWELDPDHSTHSRFNMYKSWTGFSTEEDGSFTYTPDVEGIYSARIESDGLGHPSNTATVKVYDDRDFEISSLISGQIYEQIFIPVTAPHAKHHFDDSAELVFQLKNETSGIWYDTSIQQSGDGFYISSPSSGYEIYRVRCTLISDDSTSFSTHYSNVFRVNFNN